MRQHRNYKDNWNFMREISRDWANGDDGRGDAVGRTVRAGIIYREEDVIEAISYHFIKFINGGKWDPRRHPELKEEGFSRDHTVWFVIWLRYFDEDSLHRALHIPYRICKGVYQRDVWLWIRAVARRWWIDKLIYWDVAGIVIRFTDFWNNWLYRRYGVYSPSILIWRGCQDHKRNI